MTAGIFINYRRQDTIATAGRLYDRLARQFGKNHIFMDVDRIPAGVDFVHRIDAELANCGVFLALIGPHWLDAQDEQGSPRLANPNDFVATEIGEALRRGINVIPILVDGAAMPRLESLPDPVKSLVRRNAADLRNTQFGADADRIADRIAELLNRQTTATKWRYLLIAGSIILPVLVGLVVFLTPIRSLLMPTAQTNSVENCELIGPTEPSVTFSGIFSGVIVDSGQSGAEVQLKLVRDKNRVRGSYFRAGICGTINGDVTGNRMTFTWHWVDGSGRGFATQNGDSLSGTSGFKEATEGGGTFILFLRKSR